MKRIAIIVVLSLFCLTACTITLPDLMGASVITVTHMDAETISILLRNAHEGYRVMVGDKEFECKMSADFPDVLECIGPSFKPGEEVTIKFFDGDGNEDPVKEISFVVPEPEEDFPDTEDPPSNDVPASGDVPDSDGDGVPDSEDKCPTDPKKTAPGTAGCNKEEPDADKDGVLDQDDACPEDPEKAEPGECGCGVDEIDTDGDGTPDCKDECPANPDKIVPGVCTCEYAETDSDDDGIPDCRDQCDEGLTDSVGNPCDNDEDNDGVDDFSDLCPYDPLKSAPGICGCGTSDKDTDKDGKVDCLDKCPKDPDKKKPGDCGCGVPESDADSDGDGVIDCLDACPLDPNDPSATPVTTMKMGMVVMIVVMIVRLIPIRHLQESVAVE